MRSRPSPAAFWPVAIAAATLVAYAPALSGGFVWDDDAHLTAPGLRAWSGLLRIWTEPGATQQYYPLLHSWFWLQHRLWGDAALGYHLTNVALHVFVAWLAGRFLERLAVPGAWFAAAIFALHPVHVESVAWISEQKNTLSALFCLASALAWWRFAGTQRRRDYWLAFALFALGLLTKTVVATLPAALLVIAWWRRGRIRAREDVWPLIPWFGLGTLAGLFTACVENHLIGAAGVAYELSILQRVLLAGRIPWFYLGQLVWPVDLAFIYPRWTIEPANWLAWLPLAGGVALATLLALQRRRGALAAGLVFVGTLFPVLGFLNVYPFMYSFVADHFQYLASLAAIALGAAGLARLPAGGRVAVGGAILAACGAMTWRQCHDYRNAETLYRATLARNPGCWMAWNNLGYLQLADPARNAEAIENFRQALRLRPDYAEAHGNLGLALTQAGRPAEAVGHLEEALRLKPGPYQMHNNLGIALATSGRPAEATAAFRQAAALNPTLPNIEENWGKALLLLGRREEAMRHFTRAAQLRTTGLPP